MNELNFKNSEGGKLSITAPMGANIETVAAELNRYVMDNKPSKTTYVKLDGVYWEDALLAAFKEAKAQYPLLSVRPGGTNIGIKTKETTEYVPLRTNCRLQAVSPLDGVAYPVDLSFYIEQAEDCDEPYVQMAFVASGFAANAVAKLEQDIRAACASKKHSKVAGNAVTMEFPYRRGDGCFNQNRHTAQYIDCTMQFDDLVFNPDTLRDIHTHIMSRLRNRQLLENRGVRFQSNHLLVGNYGTGKSALINSVMNDACRMGYTCILVKDARDLEFANEWAEQYEPALLICEDVNRIMEGARDVEADNLTNVLDGIGTKNRNLMTLFTANDVDQIHPVFMRPGRMASVIMMRNLLPAQVYTLLAKTSRLCRDIDRGTWNMTLEQVGDQSPSTVVEIGKAATTAAQLNGRDEILPEDILSAFRGMELQLALTNKKPERTLSERERAAQILVQGQADAVRIKAELDRLNLPDLAEVYGRTQ